MRDPEHYKDVVHERRVPALLPCATIAAALLFAATMAGAMVSYPGGTWANPYTVGHSFFLNFFCDLLRARALNGAPNRTGAMLAEIAMLAMAAGFVPFWIVASSLVTSRSVRAFARVFGILSAIGLAAVTLMPSDRFQVLHSASVLVAAIAGIIAAVTTSVAMLSRNETRMLGSLGALTLIFAAIDAALYAHQLANGGPTIFWVPALEKVAAMFLIAWMVMTSLHALSARKNT